MAIWTPYRVISQFLHSENGLILLVNGRVQRHAVYTTYVHR